MGEGSGDGREVVQPLSGGAESILQRDGRDFGIERRGASNSECSGVCRAGVYV